MVRSSPVNASRSLPTPSRSHPMKKLYYNKLLYWLHKAVSFIFLSRCLLSLVDIFIASIFQQGSSFKVAKHSFKNVNFYLTGTARTSLNVLSSEVSKFPIPKYIGYNFWTRFLWHTCGTMSYVPYQINNSRARTRKCSLYYSLWSTDHNFSPLKNKIIAFIQKVSFSSDPWLPN